MKIQINKKMNSFQTILDTLLQSIEGGQFHLREKINDNNNLAYVDFLSIGLALKECFINPEKHKELIERLKPNVDVIIGVLPPGIQSHGLIPMTEELVCPNLKALNLNEVSDEKLRRWIVDDASLIYGELGSEELRNYFSELSPYVQKDGRFLDLGSGLGKVVMTASLYFPFASCSGIEIVPYRHRMALERVESLNKLINDIFSNLRKTVKPDDHIPTSWSSEMRVSHLLDLPKRLGFQLGDMFSCDVSNADLIFIYSTCIGSLIHDLAHKLANEAPEGCLVSTTTFKMDHPGLTLIKFFPAKTVAWTDVFVYKRIGTGPWLKMPRPSELKPNLEEWEEKAWNLLRGVS